MNNVPYMINETSSAHAVGLFITYRTKTSYPVPIDINKMSQANDLPNHAERLSANRINDTILTPCLA